MSIHDPLFIDGAWVRSASSASIDVSNAAAEETKRVPGVSRVASASGKST
jgi:hypothetical protein